VRSYLSSAEPVVTDSGRSGTTHRDELDGRLDSQHFGGWRKQLAFLSPSEQAGSLGRLGPYEITDCVGRGGMGIVLKAFDPALNRHVAIKVLAAEWAHNATARRRFAREAQAAAAVVHDHVVPIHAVDASGEVPFLVMAYIPGRSLQERLDRTGPLELKEILRIGMQTAAGLAAAHAQGLVHRDIKPANILLEDSVERVRITDFGLARAVDDVSQTQSGILAGTPQYMSPEQAAGETVDHRADLFSLGSVLYAMCTGRSPFRAESTVAVIRRICDGHARPVRDINPDVPEWLADIIEKLHAKDPADRFQTAGEIADLLERHLAHVQQPSLSPRPAPFRVAPRPAAIGRRIGRRLLAVGAIVAGLAVIGPWAYHALTPDGAAQKGGQQAASEDSISSSATALDEWNAPRESSSADIAAITPSLTESSARDEIEARPLEIEFERLRREVKRLDVVLHPRLMPSNVPDEAPALFEIEQRLKVLEDELTQSAR
jgi:serine/threonine-protein kinase